MWGATVIIAQVGDSELLGLLSDAQTLFEGVCKGKIIKEKRGIKGFGYDPIFIPDDYTKTFAEMNIDEKGTISHRGKAIQKLIQFLNNL